MGAKSSGFNYSDTFKIFNQWHFLWEAEGRLDRTVHFPSLPPPILHETLVSHLLLQLKINCHLKIRECLHNSSHKAVQSHQDLKYHYSTLDSWNDSMIMKIYSLNEEIKPPHIQIVPKKLSSCILNYSSFSQHASCYFTHLNPRK